MKKPSVIVLSDQISGGAGTLANLLANDLAESAEFSVERWHFTPPARKGLFCERLSELSLSPNRRRPILERLLKNFSRKVAARWRSQRHENALLRTVEKAKPDLIHIHNIHSADINHSTLLKIPSHIPLIWTIHDLWPIKANACSWLECDSGDRYRYEIGPWSRRELLSARNRLLELRSNLTLVAPSAYVASVMSPLTRRYHMHNEMVPHVVRKEFLVPQDPAASRAKWNLANDVFWLGVGATWNNNRKGMDVLWNALSQIDCKGLGLLVWGQPPTMSELSGLTLKVAGYVDSAETLATLYAAVDAFVCPTKGDTGPLSVLETMAVGTVPVASRVGGIPERVKHEERGYLFPSQDAAALAALIEKLRSRQQPLEQIGHAAREYVLAQHTPETQTLQYTKIYQRLLQA
jgi:glycosyltransferase involved in cell wall biosynthesis